MVTKNLPYF